MNTSLVCLDTGLLSKFDIEGLKDILPEIRDDWEKKVIFRTETEARISVLNELHFPTPFAKYWQSVREQQCHFDQLVWLSFDYRRKQIELQVIENALKKAKGFKKELLQVDLDQKRYEIMSCEKLAADRVREIKQWSIIKKEELAKDPTASDSPDGIAQLKSYTEQFIWEMFNSGNNIPPADAQNIFGKAFTAIQECKKLKCWDTVKKNLVMRGLTKKHFESLGE